MPNGSHSPGGTGRLLPDATLPMRDGGAISLDAYRPKWDLVMVMLGDGAVAPEVAHLLDVLAAGRAEVAAEDGRVLAVDAAGRPAPALYVTDHSGEIYGAMRPGERSWPTSAKDVVEWLVFANIQCPECNVPESDW